MAKQIKNSYSDAVNDLIVSELDTIFATPLPLIQGVNTYSDMLGGLMRPGNFGSWAAQYYDDIQTFHNNAGGDIDGNPVSLGEFAFVIWFSRHNMELRDGG